MSPESSGAARQRVLHISEAMAGGVEAAVLEYVRSSPDRDHSIVFSRRGGYRTGDLESAGFVTMRELHGNPLVLWRGFRRMIDDVRPDVVHLHSAWAGLLGRVDLRRPSYRVVYSPHSYYFDRVDIPQITRRAARLAEFILASRTDAVAAVSPFEAEQAARMGANAVYVPNIVRIDERLRDQPRPSRRTPAIITAVGRLSAQKDPDFFIEVKRACDARDTEFEWVWLGGGDDGLRQRLRDAGVSVSGWLPREEALRRLANTDVYLHTAAWEGSPISLLEVRALRIPSVVRSIGATDSLGYPTDLMTPDRVADELMAVAGGAVAGGTAARPLPEAAVGDGDELQRSALAELYDGAVDASAARRQAGSLFHRFTHLTEGSR